MTEQMKKRNAQTSRSLYTQCSVPVFFALLRNSFLKLTITLAYVKQI